MANATPSDPRGVNATVKATSGINLGIGIWLILAPFVLPYAVVVADEAAADVAVNAAPTWNDIVVGLLVAILAGLRLAQPVRSESASWTNCGVGVWLVMAPFILAPYPYAATANDVVCGLLIAVLAALSASAARRARLGGARTGV